MTAPLSSPAFAQQQETRKSEAVTTPPENLKAGKLPDISSAEAGAKRLLTAMLADDPASVQDFFFPAAPFEALKAIPRPLQYHEKLLKWYADDIHREHAKLGAIKTLEFDGFKLGGCKWKAVGTEANKIAYWSCYKNHFYAKSGDKRLSFELRAMINWGSSWYVTHLGPIPAG